MICPDREIKLPEDSRVYADCGMQLGGVVAAMRAGLLSRLIGLVVAAALLLAGTLVLTACSGSTGSAPASSESSSNYAATADEDDAAVVEGTSSSSEEEASNSDANADDNNGGGGPGGIFGAVSVKDSVEAYSWDELKSIAEEISAAGDEAGGIEVAKKYNLCNADGTLDGAQAKTVEFTDGTAAQVQIIGFDHDDKSDGSGKAGISFLFVDCIAEHEMNSDSTNEGGWEASEMRAWLNRDVYGRLPEDLAAVIVAVDKQTNNTGWTEDESSVTTTSDLLWLPSSHELCGDIDWYSDQVYNDILNAEGTEYKLFRDMNVGPSSSNDILVKSHNGSSCSWWERSPDPLYSDYFRRVDADSYPDGYSHALSAFGVAPGFCI